MFDEYKKEEAVEPEPESKYKLISILRLDGKVIKEESELYKFYEEAKAEFDEKVKQVKTDIGIFLNDAIDPAIIERVEHSIEIDEKNHFLTKEGTEYILKKYI